MALVVGCGATHGPDDAGRLDDAGTSPLDAGPAAPDAGSPDGGALDAGGDPPEGDFEAFVTLHQSAGSNRGLAVFFEKTPGDVVITREPVGPCERRATTSSGGGFTLIRDADVGPIRVRSPRTEFRMSKADLGYEAHAQTDPMWDPGDSVRIDWAGRESLGDANSLLVGPPILSLEAPARGLFDADQDLPIRWTGDGAGRVDAALIYDDRDLGRLVSIHCELDAESDAAVLPSVVLRRILDDSVDGQVTLAVEAFAEERVRIDGWPAPIVVRLEHELDGGLRGFELE